VSILAVVPTAGARSATLQQTLRSIRDQGMADLDILIVTPVSGEELVAPLADRYGAALASDPGSGLTAALSEGLRRASGYDAYLWINDDDELTEGSLAATWGALSSREDRVLVYGNVEYVDTTGRHIATSKLGRFAKHLMAYGPNLLPQPGSLARTDAIVAAGGFDDTLRYAPDLDLFLRLRAFGELAHIDRVVARYTWHPDALTVQYRRTSLREAEEVRRRYRGPIGRILGYPADLATRLFVSQASRRLTARARSGSQQAPA